MMCSTLSTQMNNEFQNNLNSGINYYEIGGIIKSL